jgi:tRNA(fMet)-specific endonuclease VapC
VRYMLDTDIASYLLKGRDPVLEKQFLKIRADVETDICISVITRAELLYGLKCLSPHDRLHLAIRQFFKLVRILPWDGSAADFYADIRHQLVTSGQLIGELDMMIAAHALSVDAILVTNNTRHYERILQPLVLENWSR